MSFQEFTVYVIYEDNDVFRITSDKDIVTKLIKENDMRYYREHIMLERITYRDCFDPTDPSNPTKVPNI